MRFLHSMLVFAVATSALSQPPPSSQYYQDLEKVHRALVTLKDAVTAWDGKDLLKALPINTDAQAVKTKIDEAKGRATTGPAVSDHEADAILSYIESTLKPSVKDAAGAVSAKAQDFKNRSLTSIVKTALDGLSTSTTAYGNALVEKAPAGMKARAKQELKDIQALVAGAQKQFS